MLRGLAVCYACAALLGLTIGLAMPLVAVALDARGFGEAAIGVSAAAQFLGIMAGAPLGPWLIPRRGLRFSMAAALVAGAAALALMPAAGAVYGAWLALRFVFGAAEGLMFVATETWINQAVSDRSRGRAVSLYTASLAGGVALGPLLIAATGTDGVAPFLVGAAALLAGLALLGLAAGTAPRIGGARSFGILGYLAALPVAVAAAALFGFADGGLIAMLTVYGLGLGMDEVSSARLVTVLVVGGIVLMPLVGWIIDRVGPAPSGRRLRRVGGPGDRRGPVSGGVDAGAVGGVVRAGRAARRILAGSDGADGRTVPRDRSRRRKCRADFRLRRRQHPRPRGRRRGAGSVAGRTA